MNPIIEIKLLESLHLSDESVESLPCIFSVIETLSHSDNQGTVNPFRTCGKLEAAPSSSKMDEFLYIPQTSFK